MRDAKTPLLIHSLAEFRHLIFECLEAADARRIFEVGGEDGTFTRELVHWGASREAEVVCIDPAPRAPLERLAEETERLSLVRQPSVVALDSVPPGDAYLIDGDHNYFTVRQELALIFAAAAGGASPLVFLHDVGWPCGRRDFYYDPDAIPADARHEYSWDHGVTIGEPGVVKGGFRGLDQFAVATLEGGPGNGVLTAVEAFMKDRPGLSFHSVPAVFGLGVIFDATAAYAGRLTELVERYSTNPLLERLEENRLALYLAVLDLQDRLEVVEGELRSRPTWSEHDELRRRTTEQAMLLRDATVENRALWRRLEELEAAQASTSAAGPRSEVVRSTTSLRGQVRRAVTKVSSLLLG